LPNVTGNFSFIFFSSPAVAPSYTSSRGPPPPGLFSYASEDALLASTEELMLTPEFIGKEMSPMRSLLRLVLRNGE